MAQLLLTRSENQNAELLKKVQRLETAKHLDLPACSLPLLSPRAVDLSRRGKALVLDLDQFDKIIFISKNAVRFGLPVLEQYWPQWPLGLQWFAVGRATAGELSNSGVTADFPELASSEGLLGHPNLKCANDEKVLIVRGIGGRETLKQGLVKSGAQVEYLEIYERTTQHHASEKFPKGDDVIALLYSGEAIEHLYQLLGAQALVYSLVLPSKRLVELANNIGFGKVELAKNQEDDAMIDALAKTIRQMA